MEPEIQKLEAELAALRPTALDADLTDRLARAMAGRSTELSPAECQLERRLQAIEPTRPAESTMAALLTVLERLPFPGAAKVVPFPNAKRRPNDLKRRRRIPWAAAAAVALAGGLSALFVGPAETSGQKVASTQETERHEPAVTADPSAFTPASFESGVSDTHDLGRMWNGGERAMRVVKVVYKDRVTWLNENGEEVVTEVPRVEYLVVPEQVD